MEEIIDNVKRNRNHLQGGFWARYRQYDERNSSNTFREYKQDSRDRDKDRKFVKTLTDHDIKEIIDNAIQEISSSINIPIIEKEKVCDKYKVSDEKCMMPKINELLSVSPQFDSKDLENVPDCDSKSNQSLQMLQKTSSDPSLTKFSVKNPVEGSDQKESVSRLHENNFSDLKESIYNQTAIINSTENLALEHNKNITPASLSKKEENLKLKTSNIDGRNPSKLCKREKYEMIRLLQKNVSMIYHINCF